MSEMVQVPLPAGSPAAEKRALLVRTPLAALLIGLLVAVATEELLMLLFGWVLPSWPAKYVTIPVGIATGLVVSYFVLGDESARTTLRRIYSYTGVRIAMLFVTVVIGVFVTILIANMGGYMDKIRSGEIQEMVDMQVLADPYLKKLPQAELQKIRDQRIAVLEKAQGLDRPLAERYWNFLKDALTLRLGRATMMSSDSGSRQVRSILLERLPSTLVLFATANIILFFIALFLALALSRAYGTLFDRLVIALAPTSSAPGWFYGIFLLLIFAAVLGVLPFGGMVDAPPPANTLEYGLSVGKHLILPIVAWLCSGSVITIFNWRTFFLIYSSEDYVDMAKAKGLPDRMIERRYILRPTLPTIVTQFALMLITVWNGAPILETVFRWPGLGRLTFFAISSNETAVIVGATVLYAYMLAMTVFLLDIVYALIDPRVKVGGGATQ